MEKRDFSDSVKLNVITENLKRNNGEICCDICGTKLLSINDCHFDHISPFAKGGKSTLDNCQILCVKCNLKKSDKELQDFLLEEKAKRFLAGEANNTTLPKSITSDSQNEADSDLISMSKEKFDEIISNYIAKKGDIHKVDFGREYNHLPSIHYVHKYYGDLSSLKEAFGIKDISVNWNRETIKQALEQYIEQNGNVMEKDLKKKNGLPSLPCILKYYSEYSGLTELKKKMFNLQVRMYWDKQSVIQAGKDYVEKHGKITESSLCAENGLPNTRIIYKYFGSISDYQKAVGSEISNRSEFISEQEIENAVNMYFGEKERIVDSMNDFFNSFPYSRSTIHKRFGSYSAFCKKHNIIVINSKKAKYSKQEVDDAIKNWVKNGNKIPTTKELSKNGLPSMDVILKYYENWKEPFILYQKMLDKLNK